MKLEKEFISLAIVSIVGLLVGVIGPSIIGYSLGGFDSAEVISMFQSYSPYLIAGSLIIFLSVLLELLITKGDKKYGNTLFFNSLGVKPSLSFFKRFSNLQIFLLSLIFFSAFGFIIPLTGQTAFTGVGTIGQQFTETGNLIYTSLLIPISENLGVASVAIASIVFLRIIARRYNWDSALFWTLAISSTVFLWGFLGVANHLLRYSGSDYNLLIVAGFWTFCGILTVLSGSWIPAWVLHIANNLFYALRTIFTSDTAIILLGSIIVISTIVYLIIYRKNGAWYKGVK